MGALTFSQTLPVGRYQIVGMNVVCASSVFARLVFPGGTSFRPGVVTNVSYGNLILGDPFRYGRLGSYGEFEFNVPPAVEIMGTAAGAQTATVILDVVKVR